MQMGRNSDVKYKGIVVHIQTEDLGLSAKKAMAQIFHSGQIIESRSMSYAAHIESLSDDAARDEFIRKFLDSFHRDCFKRLQTGTYDAKLPLRDDRPAQSPLADFVDNMPAHLLLGDMAAEVPDSDEARGTASWGAVNQDPFFADSTISPAASQLLTPAFRGWGSDSTQVDRELRAALATLVAR